MTARLSRFGTLVVCGAMLGACAQLIGLNDYEDGAAGESGEGTGAKGGAVQGGKGGAAGSSATVGGTGGLGGSGGSGGSGGRVSGGRGGVSGKGGASGTGGSDIGGETSGGAPPEVGGTSGMSAGGEAGAPSYDCVSTEEITNVVLLPRDPDSDIWPANNTFGIVAPQIGDFADDELWVDFYASARYNGDAVGTFDLGGPPDNNYATCARCVWIGQDLGEESDPLAYFYVKSGTMVVADDSLQMDGFPIITLDKVTFVESTVDVTDTHVSRPVPSPRCLYLEHAEINMAPPPKEWKCDASYYGIDDYCDCGCGAVDPDCASQYSGACDYCGEDGACQTDQNDCLGIDPDNNGQCVATPDWTCSLFSYGDDSCDCGCGVVDPDCSSADPSVCASCADAGSCGTCAELDPADNSKCVAP